MANVRLLDYFGFEVGKPEVPGPFPRVIVWGDDFFILNRDDVEADCENPRYHMTSGYVIDETRERSKLVG